MRDAPTPRDPRRWPKTAQFATGGFIDVALCCLLIAQTSVLSALSWGLVGAVGFGGAFLALNVTAGSMQPADEAGDSIQWLDEMQEDLDVSEPEEHKSIAQRIGDNLFAGSIAGVFGIVALAIAFLPTVVTVAVFASLVDVPSIRVVAVALAGSVVLQLALHKILFEPWAQRLGVEL